MLNRFQALFKQPFLTCPLFRCLITGERLVRTSCAEADPNGTMRRTCSLFEGLGLGSPSWELSHSHALKIKQFGGTASVWKFMATGSSVYPNSHQGVTRSEHKCSKMPNIVSVRILFKGDTSFVPKEFLESLFGKEGEKIPAPKPRVSAAHLKMLCDWKNWCFLGKWGKDKRKGERR